MSKILVSALSLGAVLLAGCSGACPNVPITDARAAVNSHRSLHRTLSVMRGEARVDQRGPEGRIRGTVLFFVSRPESVRFDAMTQFGPAATLTADGEEFQLFDQREGRFLTGPACPANLGRLLGIRMRGEELARFLVGDSPIIEGERSIRCEGGEGYVVGVEGAEGQRQVLVYTVRPGDEEAPPAEQHLRLRRSELFRADGGLDWRVSFDDHEIQDDPLDTSEAGGEGRGVALPMRVRFEDPDREIDTLLRVQSVRILEAEDVPPGAFHQDTPPGLEAEWVACEE